MTRDWLYIMTMAADFSTQFGLLAWAIGALLAGSALGAVLGAVRFVLPRRRLIALDRAVERGFWRVFLVWMLACAAVFAAVLYFIVLRGIVF